MAAATSDRERAMERRFRRDGLPTFVEEWSAWEDVFNRAAPLLGLVFMLEVLGALRLDWPVWANLLAVVGGAGVLLAGLAVVNRLQGRPFTAIPQRLGKPELAAFCLVPPLLPLINAQPLSALVTLLANVALLAAIYLVLGFGLASILRWTGRRLFTELSSAFWTLARAIPLLLVFSLVIFVNLEAWQTFGTVPLDNLFLILLVFLALGTAFLVVRIPRLIDQLEADPRSGPDLDRRQRANVGLLVFVSQSLQIAAVTAAVFGFFLVLGSLLIGPETVNDWVCGERGLETCLEADQVLIGSVVAGELAAEEGLLVTDAHLRVSLGIAMVNGLYFTIAVLTDSTYREEFLDGLLDELRGTFRARAEYLEGRE